MRGESNRIAWRWSLGVTTLVAAAALAPGAAARPAAAPEQATACTAGAHTLAGSGEIVYPETGNGGYTSVHTDVDLVYDAAANRFLPGNHVVLTDQATQCLSSFSLDFERHNADTTTGPDLTVSSVTIDGKAASFQFVQPTYPGDPAGQDDPDPRAHAASQTNPVGGPDNNPLPPACSPELASSSAAPDSMDGTQCPANKLVITPAAPIAQGASFHVDISYTGRPGVHHDADGSSDGWYRTPSGSILESEPVGTEGWMPVNDHPSAKPTYDINDTVNAGRTAIGNGVLVSSTTHPADTNFPGGSVTWHWQSAAPVASYLVQSSVGNYALSQSTPADGIHYYQAQDASIPGSQQSDNATTIAKQPDITDWEALFTGAYPFSSDGVVVGPVGVKSGQEEMQTMSSFGNGHVDLATLYHETMHQWWGDNVTESGYDMTFFKEGFGQLAEYLLPARNAENAAGGPNTAAGRAALDKSLAKQFNQTYASAGKFWTEAPSAPTAGGLFDNNPTYFRPAAAYIALRQILGDDRFTSALEQIQQTYGGATVTEPQFEAVFAQWLPDQSSACQARLGRFFTQWFDTAYASGGGSNRPQITGPGLDGPGFSGGGGC